MINILSFLLIIFVSLQTQAGSLYDVKIKNESLYDIFKKQGIPEAALQRTFEFIDVNGGKTVRVKAKIREKTRTYMGERSLAIKTDVASIIDFSLPSSERRLYILNLKTGAVSKHFVAHGKGSGINIASKFSNLDGSKMSSLGFFLGGSVYYGTHGQSLNLHGLETTNDKAAERDIVIHAADYVSEDFVKMQGRLGRSWGCPAVAPGIINKMITNFRDGGVIYAYHKDLIGKEIENPVLEVVTDEESKEDIDLPGEEETVRKAPVAVTEEAK